MAVQIPKINTLESEAPQSVGRMQAEAPNLLGATAPLREGLNSLVNTTVDAIQTREKELKKQQLAAKDLKYTEKAIQYEQALKSRLDVAKQMKGDPTSTYQKFDEDMTEAQSSIYEGVSDPEDLQILNEKIVKANGRIQDLRSTNYTTQYFGWQKEVSDSSVKLRQDNATKASQYFDVKNVNSYAGIRSSLDEIEGTRVSVALSNGYKITPVTKEFTDPKTGEKRVLQTGWDYSEAPAIESQIKADIGHAVIPMVKTLNDAGKVKEAKFIIENNKKWFNAEDLAKLTADNDEASVKNQALALINTLPVQSGKAAFDAIEKTDATAAIKFKARELVDTRDRQNQNAEDRKRKQAEAFLYQHIDQKQASVTPYVSVAQFKESPEYKEMKDVLTPSDLKALEQRIEAPTVSDPKAKEKISEIYRTTAFKKMTDENFNKLLTGLDKQDRERYWNLRETVTKPPKGMTEAQMRSRMESMNSYFFADAKAAGIIPKTNRDKWTQADQQYYTDKVEPAWTEFYTKLDQNITDPNTQKSKVRDFIREFTENPDNAPPRKGWFNFGARELRTLPTLPRSDKAPNSPLVDTTQSAPVSKQEAKPVSNSVDINNMNDDQIQYWVGEYIKETGANGPPEKQEEFQAWINKKVKK